MPTSNNNEPRAPDALPPAAAPLPSAPAPESARGILPDAAPPPADSMQAAHPLLLPALMIGGAACGLLLGGFCAERWTSPEFSIVRGICRLLGDILLNTLKMLVVPLIIFSVISSMASIGDIRRAGRIFTMTMSYFVLTMICAATLGLVMVNTIKPGVGASTELRTDVSKKRAEQARGAAREHPSEAVFNVIRDMFPPNLFKAAADGQVLGLIVFGIIFGAMLTTMGAPGLEFAQLCRTLNDAFMRIVQLVIWLAPIGIMGLLAERIGSLGGMTAIKGELTRLGWYALTVVIGLLIHGVVVLPLFLYLLARRNPLIYARNVSEALLCAFTTASSSATLPLTIKTLEQNNRVSPRAVGLVVPLGATVNMNGTALYEAVAAIFIAQAYGIELNLAGQVLIVLTSTLAAIGAAAIPEAGLVTMVIVLTAAGLPVEGAALLISIDWILDRCRTTVNVWDDCVATAVVEKWMQRADAKAS